MATRRSIGGNRIVRPTQIAFLLIVIVSVSIVWSLAARVGTPERAVTFMTLGVAAVLLTLTVRFFPTRLHFTNRSVEDRIANLVDMLQRAKHEVVLVTGSLNHKLYGNGRVVDALRRLPISVRIRVLHTKKPIDWESSDFIEELKVRAVRAEFVTSGNIRHALIIDGAFTKIEEAGVSDNAEEKCADYYYYNRRMAERILAEVGRIAVEPSEWPPTRQPTQTAA